MKLSKEKIMAGWQVVRFGDIAKEVKTNTNDPLEEGLEHYIGLEHIDSQSLRLQRKGSIAEDNPTFTKKFSKGHILFGRRRAYLKKAAVAGFDGICSGDITVIEAKPGKIIPGLLPFIVQSDMFFDWAVKHSAGGLSPRVKWKSLAEFEFLLPPISRQREILEVLEKVEECLLNADKSIDCVLNLKRKSITKLFSAKGLTGKSKQVRLKDVIEIVSGQVDPTHEPYSSLPHIAPDNMSKSTGQLLEYKTAEQDNVTSGKYEFDESWFLYSKIRPNLRKICFPKFQGICSADVYPIRGTNGALTSYLFYLMQSEHFNRYAESNSMRSGFPKINRDDLGAYKFYLPDPDMQAKTTRIHEEYDKTYQQLLSHREKVIKLNTQLLADVCSVGVQ